MEIITCIAAAVKAAGEKVMLELVRNAWIKFALGFVLLCYGISLIKWW
ncbi:MULTISPECIES: hypothetical protein [Neisseria]|nr:MULTISPECIES: hypothetical protein [Neisseria]CBX21332.1 unnamed protein product [Neisseria lactamica Y92-1009]